MAMGKIIEWLKDVNTNGKVIVAVVVIIAFAFYPDSFLKLFDKPDSNPSPAPASHYSAQGDQVIAPITATNGGSVSGVHIGDTHHHGLSMDDAMKLAEKLAAEKGEQDAQLIKSLQDTIQALTQQNPQQYDIQQAFDRLAQGDTTQAEAIFTAVAEEAKQAGQAANSKEAEALRHLGSLAFLHDTQKALTAYQRSTELDPDNWDGWNNLGHLYRRIGELENAENAYTTVQKLSLQQGDRTGEAVAYGNLGIVYRIRGELDRAVEYHERSLAIEKELGRKEGMASDYGNLGIVYETRGELDRAVDYWKQSLALFQQLGAKDKVALVQSWLDATEQEGDD